MSEVASAYVSLMFSAQGAGKQIESQLNGELGSVGQRQGKKIGGKLTGALGGAMKTGMKVGVAGAVATAGVALAKGFGRLKAIDQAKAQLRGLKLEGSEIQGVMDSATKAVTGTAYGLDSAASAAAGALGSGVKQGKQLENYLTLIGDATAQSTTDFNSMALMMNKVQGQGKLTGDVMQQMAENGLYVMPMLADALGKPQEEIQKMVSKGEISAKQFQSILKDNIGGAAQESGKTFSGALANMGAALGRVGAKVLGGVFPKLAPMFSQITGWLDGMGPAAEKFGSVLGDGFTRLGELLAEVGPRVSGFFQAFSSSGGGGQVGQVLGEARAALAEFWTYAKTVFQVASVAVSAFWRLFGPTIIAYIKPTFKNVLTIIGGAFKVIRGIFKTIGSLLRGDWKGAWDGIKTIVSGAWQIIRGVVAQGANVLKTVFRAAGIAMREAARASWEAIKAAFRAGVSAAVEVVKSLGARISAQVRGFGSLLYNAGRTLIQGLVNGILSKIGDVAAAIGKVAGKVKNFLPGSPVKEGPLKSWNNGGAGKRLVGLLVQGLKAGEKDAEKGAIGVAKAISKPVTRLDRLARRVMRGLRRGIVSEYPRFSKAIVELGKKLEKDAPKGLKKAREAVLKGLLGDAKQAAREARRRMNDYAREVRNAARDFGGLSTIQPEDEEPLSASTILEGLTSRADTLAGYRKNLAAIRKRIGKDLYRQIVEMGPEQGAAFAEALANATPQEIAAIRAQNERIIKSSKALGKAAGKEMYGAGVNAADGFVKGVEKMIDKFGKAGVKLGKEFVKRFKKLLGIKSPSRVFLGFGEDVVDGFILGVARGKDDAAAAAARLVGSATAPLSAPSVGVAASVAAGAGAGPAEVAAVDLSQRSVDAIAAAVLAGARTVSVRAVDYREYSNDGAARFPSPVPGVVLL